MTKPPTFIGVHLTVADIVASARFYRQIGLPLRDAPDLGEHVEIDLGHSIHLALSTERVTRAYDPGWRPPTGPARGALQFHLESREAVGHELLLGSIVKISV